MKRRKEKIKRLNKVEVDKTIVDSNNDSDNNKKKLYYNNIGDFNFIYNILFKKVIEKINNGKDGIFNAFTIPLDDNKDYILYDKDRINIMLVDFLGSYNFIHQQDYDILNIQDSKYEEFIKYFEDYVKNKLERFNCKFNIEKKFDNMLIKVDVPVLIEKNDKEKFIYIFKKIDCVKIIYLYAN
ncbi:MAG: hypothetical protein QXG00_04090 [Candidatus Woesearchaeota archaeon]